MSMIKRFYEEMEESAGYRELFAMEHGTASKIYINNELCYKFTYPNDWEYQDGNGATYNTKTKKWIN